MPKAWPSSGHPPLIYLHCPDCLWERNAHGSTVRSIARRRLFRQRRSRLRTVLFEYIETFYTRHRHQARLGHRTPAEAYAADRAA